MKILPLNDARMLQQKLVIPPSLTQRTAVGTSRIIDAVSDRSHMTIRIVSILSASR